MVQGLDPGRGKRFVCSPKRADRLLGPLSLLLNGYRGSVPRVKWPGSEVYHSLPSSAEVKNEWSYTSTPPTCLHGVELFHLSLASLRCGGRTLFGQFVIIPPPKNSLTCSNSRAHYRFYKILQIPILG
jgi:hypothetical protein